MGGGGGLAICENPDIQIWQNPMAPKDSLTCLLVVSWFIWLMTCFCSMPKASLPFFIINLRYFTSVWQIWAFFHDTLYPAWSSKPRKVLVPSQHREQISAIRSRSTYCRIWHLVVSDGKERRSVARASPNIIREFFNPLWQLSPSQRSSPTCPGVLAKILWLTGATFIQKKAKQVKYWALGLLRSSPSGFSTTHPTFHVSSITYRKSNFYFVTPLPGSCTPATADVSKHKCHFTSAMTKVEKAY